MLYKSCAVQPLRFTYSFATHQQVIYLWQFFPSNLASIWRSVLGYPMHDISALHSNLHAQSHHWSSMNRRCWGELFAMYASDIDCCFYRRHWNKKKETHTKKRKIIDLVKNDIASSGTKLRYLLDIFIVLQKCAVTKKKCVLNVLEGVEISWNVLKC